MKTRFASFRKDLPLPVRRGYGWARRKLIPHPVWDHDAFKHYYGQLLESQWRSKEQLEADQQEQLARLIAHAYENVPYYRRVFDEHKLKPADVRTFEDLVKIPLLTKELVRGNLDDLVARNFDRKRLRFKTTSGSTGTPLGLYDEGMKSVIHEDAFRYRQWSWAGYGFGDRLLTFRYPVSRIDRQGRSVGWDFSASENALKISPSSLDEERSSKYMRFLRAFEPQFLEGTPSCLEILAHFVKRNDIPPPKISAVFCESEILYSRQRQLLEEQFQCKVFSGYGHTERCVDAVECEAHEGYHASMEYGLFELVDAGGEPVLEPGKTGRVVGTGFDNYAMPLIRYATDDLARFGRGKCSCGRGALKIEEIIGRTSEFVISRSGHLIPLSAIYGPIHSAVLDHVRELRFSQDREGELGVQVILAPGSNPEMVERELLSEIYSHVDSQDLSVAVRFIERLPRSESGKAGLMLQKIHITFDDFSIR
jgi:phenylacetate-CoA ligase